MTHLITCLTVIGVVCWVAFAVSRSLFWQRVYGAIAFAATAFISVLMAFFVLLLAVE